MTDTETKLRRLGDLIPQTAVRIGWNLANPSFSVNETGRESWSVDLIGPTGLEASRVTFPGGYAYRKPRFWTGVIGTFEADTYELLVSMVTDALEILGFRLSEDSPTHEVPS